MDSLVANHQNLISKVQIGNTYEKRPMYALKVKQVIENINMLFLNINIA